MFETLNALTGNACGFCFSEFENERNEGFS